MADRVKINNRVAILAHTPYLYDPRVRRQAESLASMDIEVHVVCIRRSKRANPSREPSYEVVNGVHIYRIPSSKRRGRKLRYFYEYAVTLLFGLWKITRLNHRKRFDVVHIHNMPDLLVIAGLIPKLTGAVLVLDIHDPMSELFQANYHLHDSHLLIRALRLQEKFSYKLAKHLITVSLPMAENVACKRGCEKEAITVVHNYPDLSSFPIRENKKPWPYNGNKIVFLYTGTVTEHYQLDIAVKALALVSRTIPNIEFRILGVGNRLEEVLSLAQDLGIGDKVVHLRPVLLEQVKDIMASADVGISTHSGGKFGDLYFSTKIIEFMTQGLPVISSRTYTIEQYIPNDSIIYFEPGKVEDLASQIMWMYNNPSLVEEKIQNSRKLLAKYNWQEEKRILKSFYKNMVMKH